MVEQIDELNGTIRNNEQVLANYKKKQEAMESELNRLTHACEYLSSERNNLNNNLLAANVILAICY